MSHSPLDETYDHKDLIGLDVVTETGELIGPVVDILPGAANDNLIVRSGSEEILIPFIGPVIMSIDLAARQITIDAIDGLLDLNEKKDKRAP